MRELNVKRVFNTDSIIFNKYLFSTGVRITLSLFFFDTDDRENYWDIFTIYLKLCITSLIYVGYK